MLKERSALANIILLILLTLLALGLRLYKLDAQSLWYDEGFSVYLARMDLAEITARTAADIQPPLYYYLLHGWIQLVGDSEAALRGFSLLLGVLTVPLMYAVAWQLFHERLSALLAALLLAVSPLHVWYGQEVRMYTLLTFLCLLSSYLLLLVIQLELRPGKKLEALALWVAYTLITIAAVYTHYFAFFVLAFQALYLFLVWWERGLHPARLLLGGLVAGVITVLAYLPWLPYLFNRYGVDVSYWPGQLKLPEVLLDIVLSFVGGESVLQSPGTRLAIGYGLIFFLCLLMLVLEASGTASHDLPKELSVSRHSQYPLAILLLYLVIPPALILILSYNAPKFNARYAMVSHPAFLLILAGGLGALWRQVNFRGHPVRSILAGLVAGLALTFILGVSAYANYNAYADPAFARADFRGVARYLRRHVAPDEVVVLSSGHMFPVFDYYASGLERYLLPDSPTLDTTRTLDYSIAADLNDWLAGRGGVWVVRWQDEVVDPVGYLAAILATVGDEQAVSRSFPKIDLQHYRLPSGAAFSEQPAIAHPADFNFGNRLRLLGYSQTGEEQVTLFWQALRPLDEDYRVTLSLRDTLGQAWGQWDGRPTTYLFPTERWSVGQTVFGRYDLVPMPGTPPGDYGLEVGVYSQDNPNGLDVLDQAGAPQGTRVILGAVRMSVPPATADQVETPHPGRIDLGGGLALLGWDLDRKEAQPGDQLLLTLVWSVETRPQDDYGVRLLVSGADGRVLDAGTFPPTNMWHPTSAWQPGQAWRGQVAFRLPIETQPGEARLSLQLVGSDGTAPYQTADLTAIRVLATDRIFTPPQPQVSQPANFGGKIGLVGFDVDPQPASPGDALRVTLYWQALSEMDVPYSAFVHLLGSDGRVVAGHDSQPAGGVRPTTGWVQGEFVTDLHELSLPADLAAGEYLIEAGWYDGGLPGMPRLLIVGDEGQVQADRELLGPVDVQ